MSNRIVPLYQPGSAKQTLDGANIAEKAIENGIQHDATAISYSNIQAFRCNSDSGSSNGESPWNREGLEDDPGNTAQIILAHGRNNEGSISTRNDPTDISEERQLPSDEIPQLISDSRSRHESDRTSNAHYSQDSASQQHPFLVRSLSARSQIESASAMSATSSRVLGNHKYLLRSFSSRQNPLLEVIKQKDLGKNTVSSRDLATEEEKSKEMIIVGAVVAILFIITFVCSYYTVRLPPPSCRCFRFGNQSLPVIQPRF